MIAITFGVARSTIAFICDNIRRTLDRSVGGAMKFIIVNTSDRTFAITS
jgi:hypothetical protein